MMAVDGTVAPAGPGASAEGRQRAFSTHVSLKKNEQFMREVMIPARPEPQPCLEGETALTGIHSTSSPYDLIYLPPAEYARVMGDRPWGLSTQLASVAFEMDQTAIDLSDQELADRIGPTGPGVRRRYSARSIPKLLAPLQEWDLIRIIVRADGGRRILLAWNPRTGQPVWTPKIPPPLPAREAGQ